MPGRWRKLRMYSKVIQPGRPDGSKSLVLRAVGALDWTTSEEFQVVLHRLLRRERPARLVLDLSAATPIDSSGIGALLLANDKDARCTLCGLSGPLLRVLERTRLRAMFEICPTWRDALHV
ncbi:MAG: STAS domain-containing protein [Acidobacteriia bacterium]|nr:STAS domain-containing protein [Terriglobia bacterium]